MALTFASLPRRTMISSPITTPSPGGDPSAGSNTVFKKRLPRPMRRDDIPPMIVPKRMATKQNLSLNRTRLKDDACHAAKHGEIREGKVDWIAWNG